MRRLPDGRVTPHYDPAMVMQFAHRADDYNQWDDWDRLDIPMLIAGCGHAPALNTPAQLIERFLAAR